ncbi:hypothetical protein R1sor_012843 [Riccia sorocarpa]|uniref:Uncharacterized protein n=1 Tax=Riccia sorocarpa TaxID=122646 RepID=A0ABD3I7N5_9MARC
MLRIAGATFIEMPAAPYKNPNNYVKYSGRLAEAIAKSYLRGAIWGNQFDNIANRRARMADSLGAAMYNYYSRGVIESSGNSISEGIGQGRITANLDGWVVPTIEGGTVDFCNLNR